ncbi:TrwN protein [Bartonella sp. 220]|uniref:TrwN protein n=1 Tax=Bartonella sp. 220B TaxID=2967260 RepID=UPI0022A8FDBE|nr:TrwN protein [Bartonella sp. 220B]MCZ2157919.1 TrwN protein [Bartonella sp. 220B]
MSIPNFITLSAVCASAVHPATISTVVMQKSLDDIYAININDHYKLSRQSFTTTKAIVTTKHLTENRHNPDVSLKNGFIESSVKKVVSSIEVETHTLSDDKTQETIQSHAERSDQIGETEALPSSSEERVDAFAHKISGAHDIFTAEDTSFQKQQE